MTTDFDTAVVASANHLDRFLAVRDEAGSEENFAKLCDCYAGALSLAADVEPNKRSTRAIDAICGQLVTNAAERCASGASMETEGAAIVFMSRAIGKLAELIAVDDSLDD